MPVIDIPIDALATNSCRNDPYDALYQENLDNRILVINEAITEAIIENYVLWILKWNRDDKDLPIDKRKTITIFVNSEGGSLFDGNSLIDAILMSKTKIRAVAMDFVASMAYLIFLACDERYGFKNAVYLMHDGELSLSNSGSKFKDTVKFFDEMDRRTKEYVLSRTNISEEFYDKVYDQEFWMLGEKAKELGVIHKIIGEDCDIDEVL